MKRSHKKKPPKIEPAEKVNGNFNIGGPQAIPKPNDGEAKTAAEPVPDEAPRRGRHPDGCQCPVHRDGGAKKKKSGPDLGSLFVKGKRGYKIHPRLSRIAALAPMMLVGAAGATFFDQLIPYEQENIEGCQEMFEAWMDELGLEFGPGWQYGALCLYTIAMGIRNAETLTPEMKEAMKQAKEAQKAAMRAEAIKRAQAAADVAKGDGAKVRPDANGVAKPSESSGVEAQA